MAIVERKIKKHGQKHQWEISATGKDVAALKDHMRDAADAANEKSEKEAKELGFFEMEKPDGTKHKVRNDHVGIMERKGAKPARKSFIVPDLPWLRKGKKENE